MTDPTVFKKTFPAPALSLKEICRYAGCPIADKKTEELITECLKETEGCITYQTCWCQLSVSVTENGVRLGRCDIPSKNLKSNLMGCKTAVIFAATLGIQIDRLISKYGKISPSKAIIIQAIGAERIEALCNSLEEEILKDIEKTNLFLRPRFSPGYGDFDISLQKQIFNILNCSKHIGLTLNSSLLMSPTKSVTAIIGISEEKMCNKKGCEDCTLSHCEYRR